MMHTRYVLRFWFIQIYVYDCKAKYTLSAVIATQSSASTAIDFSTDGRYIKVHLRLSVTQSTFAKLMHTVTLPRTAQQA
jgi:hypothetical protein